MERLQKIIANNGYCSRRKAEELISLGKVKVNGEIITELGYKTSTSSLIEVEGNNLSKDDKVYILLNKPRGVISTASDDKNRKTVVDLINEKRRIYPIGRLDYDTTGVLLLTNDGILSNMLMHPSSEIDKTYIAKIKGIINSKDLNILKNGVIIDGHKTAKARVKIKKIDKKTNSSYVEIIIHEGKNHQVKKMLEVIGYEVEKLKREKYAFLDVGSLKSGEYRYLSIKEIKTLYSLVK